MTTEKFGDILMLDLREPIKLADLEFTSLTLTEPTGEQLQRSYKAVEPMAGLFSLIADTAGVSPAVPKKMRQRDLQRAADFFAHFDPASSLKDSEITPQS